MWPFRFAMRNKRGLPQLVMYLLASSPRNGMELMDGVETVTRGWWRPTPGSIYPLLKEMSDEGVVKKREDGKYELTDKGRAQSGGAFGPRPHWPRSADDMVSQMQGFVSYLEDVKSADPAGVDAHAVRLREIARRIADLVGEEHPNS